MEYDIYVTMVRGFAIAIFLAAIGLKASQPRWWIAMLSLNLLAAL